MDITKVGNFIKQLRKDKGLTQEELADLIPIDRATVSRWESGKVLPPVDKIKILSNIFNVTVDELLLGKRNNTITDKETNLLQIIFDETNKLKKSKKVSILILILSIIILLIFLSYYFFQTYNTQQVYKITTDSEDYVVTDGILFITRENSYFKIGAVNDEIIDISIYYINDDEEKLIFMGDSDSVLIDYYKYNGNINLYNIDKMKDNLYLKINDEYIKLNLNREYSNNHLFLKEVEECCVPNSDSETITRAIPLKIKETFSCDADFCYKNINGCDVNYGIYENIIYIRYNDVSIQYIIGFDIFYYIDNISSFEIKKGELICNYGNCDNYEDIYEKYNENIIKPLL